MSSGSSQIVQLALETTVGTTPSPFDRDAVPFTSVTIDASTTKTDSETILDSRIAQQGAITAVEYTGNLEAEFRSGLYDELISATAYNNWVADTPAVGTDQLTFGGALKKTFSAVRGYSDILNFHTFRGLHLSAMTLTIPETGFITLSFTFMGLGRSVSNTIPVGTVTVPDIGAPATSIGVGQILIDGVSQAGSACISSFEFTWDNGIQKQTCLGAGLDVGALIASGAAGTGKFTAAWSATSALNYEKQFSNETLALVVPFTDSLGNAYELTLPQVETKVALPSGAKGDILKADFEFTVVEEAPVLTRTLV